LAGRWAAAKEVVKSLNPGGPPAHPVAFGGGCHAGTALKLRLHLPVAFAAARPGVSVARPGITGGTVRCFGRHGPVLPAAPPGVSVARPGITGGTSRCFGGAARYYRRHRPVFRWRGPALPRHRPVFR